MIDLPALALGFEADPTLLVILVTVAFFAGVGITTVGPGGIFLTAALYALTPISSNAVAGTAHATFVATGLVGSGAYVRSGELRTGESRALTVLLGVSSICRRARWRNAERVRLKAAVRPLARALKHRFTETDVATRLPRRFVRTSRTSRMALDAVRHSRVAAIRLSMYLISLSVKHIGFRDSPRRKPPSFRVRHQ